MLRDLAVGICVSGLLMGCDASPPTSTNEDAPPATDAQPGVCDPTAGASSATGYLSRPNTTLDEDVEYLIRMTGAAAAGEAISDALLEQLPPTFPDAPPEFWVGLAKRFKPDEFVAVVVPIYAKHFSQAEVRQMIAFNETPLGQKMINVMPTVELETMRAADEWGTKIGAGVVADLRAAGYAPAPPPTMPIPGAPTVP
jgi:uncharacterized protein